jgi:GWxTD domain-containing protein
MSGNRRARLRRLAGWTAFLPVLFLLTPASAQEAQAVREPVSEASKQWLEEVVPYIITPAEREVFLGLPNEAERGRFIERFWRKRDPDPATPANEFQRQYYLRIALADKFFGNSGVAGWRTDRGRIFILLGPPHEIQRDFNVAGASGTGRFDTETWQYWGLPNPKLPYNVEFVFIDRYGTGRYVLDTGFEMSKRGKTGDLRDMTFLFDSMEILAEAQRNPFENLDKIKTVITTQVTYDLIPFDIRSYAFRGAGTKTHIPLVIEVPAASLPEGAIDTKGEVSLEIIVHISDALGRVVAQRSKTLRLRPEPARKDAPGSGAIRFRTSVELETGPYGIHVVVWDNLSGKTGTRHLSLAAPDFGAGKFGASDIVLSSGTEEAGEPRPVLDAPGGPDELLSSIARRKFRNGEEMEVALEIYGLTLDGRTGRNSLRTDFVFLQGPKALLSLPAFEPAPSDERDCLVANSLRLKNFRPGEYSLRVTITDIIAGRSVVKETIFTVED